MTSPSTSKDTESRSDFIVRPATSADTAMICSLDQQMWGTWANPPPLYRQLIDAYPDTVLVAYSSEGQFAGFTVGLVRSSPVRGWVLSIDIGESFRGSGLGRLILSHLMVRFKELKVHEVVAIIDPTNTASQRLFASFGFNLVSLEKDYFGPGKDQHKWIFNSSPC